METKENLIETYRGTYKGVLYNIVKWTMDGSGYSPDKEVWNSYIFVEKRKVSEADFKKFNVKGKKYQIIETSPVRMIYNYDKLSHYFEMSGGLTYYSKEYTNEGKIWAFKFGNDYNHIWNTGYEDLDSVRRDIHNSINSFLEKIILIK